VPRQKPTPLCAPSTDRRSVVEFCHDLVAAADRNQTRCLEKSNLQQSGVESTSAVKGLLIILVTIVVLSVTLLVLTTGNDITS